MNSNMVPPALPGCNSERIESGAVVDAYVEELSLAMQLRKN
jgi:hypothetical protein